MIGIPMTQGIIFDLRRYSIHDGPGIRTTVFFKGCPLHCAWCHNPESISFQPELILRSNRCILCDDCLEACRNGAVTRQGDRIVIDRKKCQASGDCVAACAAEALEIAGREMSVEEVMEAIERDRVFYDQSGGGATFSGGEPLAQRRFLRDLLTECRARGLHAAVDTSGLAPWRELDELRPLVDLFLYDLKMMDSQRHRRFTGVPNERILDNLRRLIELGQAVLVRIPVVPGVNDDEDNLAQTGAFLSSLPVRPPVELLPYHSSAASKYAGLGREAPLAEVRSPEAGSMEAVAAVLRRAGLQVKV